MNEPEYITRTTYIYRISSNRSPRLLFRDVNRVPGPRDPKNYPIPGFKLPESYPRVRFPTQKRQDCWHSRDSLSTVVY